MKKVLICGATGFVGKNLVYSLSKRFKIYAVYNKKPKFYLKNVKWIKADLRKLNNCLKVTKNCDIVIQAAATTSGSKDIINSPYIHVTDNAIMNSYILKSSFINKVKHFIFTSCTVMYKNSETPLNETDVDNTKIFDGYFGVANTKLYIEKMCEFYSKISDTKFSIIRHSNLYGPYDKYDLNKGHFIGSSVVKIFDKKKEIKIFFEFKEKRDYLYIEDFIIMVKNIVFKQKYNIEIFNCTYGKSYKIKDVLKKMIEISKTNKEIKHVKGKNLNINILVSSVKAKKKLGWYPKTKLNVGIRKTLSWYKNYYG